MKQMLYLLPLLALVACDDYVPTEKKFIVDPTTHGVILPAPCPDWSHDSTVNYDNSANSNFGCATANNTAIQLADPGDAIMGHGEPTDTQSTVRTITRYRAGEIPTPLAPISDIGGGD